MFSGLRKFLLDSEALEMLQTLLESRFVQDILGWWLLGFFIGVVLLAVQYLFFIIPNLQRAQILNDVVTLAVQEQKVAVDSKRGSKDSESSV